jgi:hypothetical protein
MGKPRSSKAHNIFVAFFFLKIRISLIMRRTVSFEPPPMTKPAAEIAKISWPIGAGFFSFSVTSH